MIVLAICAAVAYTTLEEPVMPEDRPTTEQRDDVVGAPILSDPALWAAIIALHMRGVALDLRRELRAIWTPWSLQPVINCRCSLVINLRDDEDENP